jgi:hypothetical protein
MEKRNDTWYFQKGFYGAAQRLPINVKAAGMKAAKARVSLTICGQAGCINDGS